MPNRNMESMEIKNISDFEKAQKFVLEMLHGKKVANPVITETMLIFETLFHEILSQKKDADTAVTIMGQERLGCVSIQFLYEGERYITGNEQTNSDLPEEKILQAYSDKVNYSYQFGFNRIRISIRNSHVKVMLPCGLAVLYGILFYFLLHFLGDESVKESLLSNIILPLEILFGNAMLMIGAPVTFLSLLKNLTNAYIVSERSNYIRMLRKIIFQTSIVSVLLAVAASLPTAGIVMQKMSFTGSTTMKVDMSLPDFIVSLVPADIFAPFQMISPFPLIISAVLVTYALCSVGEYFDWLKKAVDACYELFSKMLSIIMAALPTFVFLAILNMLLVDGIPAFLYMAELTLAVLLSLIFMVAFYWIRLKKNGIGVLQFVKKLKPLLTENYKIGSVIDAVPYNIRYCSRVFHMERKKLMLSIPILAQINLDGNCFILTYISMILMLNTRTDVSWVNIALIPLLVFFLSLGAPNQPGSCMIGILIILTYMHASDLIPLAIFSEVVFGSLLDMTNITGDIVTVAELEQREKSYETISYK